MSQIPGLCSTMINTYQTSLAPPPLPPRANRSHQVLIPAPVTSQSYSRSLIRFMVGVVILHMVLSVVGFIFLYNGGKILGNYQGEDHKEQSPETGAYISPEKQKSSNRVLASMVVKTPSPKPKSESGYIQWETEFGLNRHGVIHYLGCWLLIMESGDYYVYSRVTFSRNNSTRPLVNRIKLKKSKSDAKDKTIMHSYCHLNTSKTPSMCTAMQGDVITLTKGNLLSVWVEDLSLVDYEAGATTFGLFSL